MRYNKRAALTVLLFLSLVILTAVALIYFFMDDLRSPEALYTEAQSANPTRAANLYQRIAEGLPLIQEYTWLWAAEAMGSDPEKLLELHRITAYYPRSPAAYLAFIELARFYAGEQPDMAVAAYQAALDLKDDPALRLEMARYLEEQGDMESAYLEYRSLLNIIPDAFEDMRRTASDPAALAADLLEAAYFSDVLEVLGGENKPEYLLLEAQALFGLERYDEAELAYREWLGGNPGDLTAQLGLAKVLVFTGRVSEALELYQEIDTNDSRLEMAKLLESEHPDQALDLYLDSPYPVAWWNATWILEENEQFEQALEEYKRIAAAGTYFSDDAAYRLYNLGLELGDEQAVKEAEAILGDLGPNWLAKRANQGAVNQISDSEIEKAHDQILEKINILESFGRDDLVYLELLFGSQFIDFPGIKIKYLEELAARGYILEAQEIAQAHIIKNPEASVEFWQLNYPRPYPEIVNTAAETYGIDPLLIWAVMRVESSYETDALSLAGARGLLQLMPSTQEWISEQLKQETQPGDAYVPEENIKMGAWFLSYLLEYFDGDLDLAVMAYNAGAASVEEWQADPMVNNRDDLIRWVWFGESREYLQRVSLAYSIYQELYQ